MRCAELSSQLVEPMLGTAATGRAWLAVEDAGPWGARAPGDSRLPESLTARLMARAARAGVKVLLIRGAHTSGDGPRTCLLAHGGPAARRFLEIVRLDAVTDVLEIDLDALAAGAPTGSGRVSAERHYLTCVNGKRDACCALRGRPVARTVAELVGDRAWQCTHLGAHRFAANTLVLPDGLLFGRLDPVSSRHVVQALEADQLDLAHLRGRSGEPAAVQAAEILLRAQLGVTAADAVQAVAASPPVFAIGGRHYRVSIECLHLPRRPLSCGAETSESPVSWQLTDTTLLEEVEHV